MNLENIPIKICHSLFYILRFCSNNSSSAIFENLQADTISCKFIRISDDEQFGRWQIGYESRAALCFRDRFGEGDKRYAMYNNKYVDIK